MKKKKASQTVLKDAGGPVPRAVLESVLHAVRDAILYFDAAGKPVFANKTAIEVLGFDPVSGAEKSGPAGFSIRRPDGTPMCFDELLPPRKPYSETIDDERYIFSGPGGHDSMMLASWSPLMEKGKAAGAVLVLRPDGHKNAEEALRKNESIMRGILDAAQESIWLFGEDGTILMGNETALRRMNRPPSEVIGRFFGDVVPAHLVESRMARLRQAIDTGSSVQFEDEREGIRFLHSFYPVPDAAGRVSAVVSFSRDITAARQAERDLRENEERFRTIAEFTYDWEYWISPEGDYLYVSPSCGRITGYDCEEFLADPNFFFQVVHPDDRDAVMRHYRESLPSPLSQEMEFRIITRDGQPRWIGHVCTPVFSPDGQYRGRRGSNRDITARKQTEEALRDRTERYELIVAGAHAAIWDWDVLNKRVYYSPQWKAMRGFADDEINDSEDVWSSGIHPGDAPRVHAAVQAHFEGKTPVFAEEYRILCRDGSWKWIFDRGIALRDAGGNVVRMAGSEGDITGRKLAEAQLERSREELEILVRERTDELNKTVAELDAQRRRFNDVLELLPAYLVLLTPDYHVAFANRFFRERFGESHGRRCYEYLFGRSEPCEVCDTYTVLKTMGPHEWDWTGPDGRNYHIFDLPFTDTDGSTLIMEMGIDITVRNRMEQMLILKENRLSEAQRIAHMGNWELNLESGELIWSEEIYRIFEIDPNEFKASYEAFLSAIHPEDREAVNRAYSDSVANKTPYDIFHRLLMKDGRIKYVNERCETYYGTDGRPLRSAGTVQDITERIRAEERLKDASLYARNLIEASIDPMVTISPEGKITDVNAATEEVTGLPRGDLIGMDFSDYFTEPEKAREGYKEVFARGFVRDYPLAVRHVSGRITEVLYNATVYKNREGRIQGVFAAARDITDKKAAEAELEKYHLQLEDLVGQRTGELEKANFLLQSEIAQRQQVAEELERSNRDLEQFAYVASHDLQEPLRAISGFVSLLNIQLKSALDSRSTEYMNFINDGVTRMQTLINGLLEYSRIGTRGKSPEPADVHDVLDRVLLDLQPMIRESGVHIHIEPMPVIYIDPVQLKQLFQNLISNAVKFRNQDNPEINVSAERVSDSWRFAVRDNGIGIEAGYAERIFLIFQRLHTRKQYPGTGIGLALCKKIVERYGGSIWVESSPGQGSTFYFTIPCNDEAQ